MKTTVVVFLLLCGTLLILAPLLHNIVIAAMITVTMAKTGGDASIRADLPHFEALVVACVIVGIAMSLCGVIGGFRGLGSRSGKD